jgi:hypothetical protein
VEARGSELFGTVAVPEWLDKLIGDGTRKISCTWDKATKRLIGLALVREPRISDAALYAAFGEFAGKRHSAQDIADLQTIHDLAAKQGAECASAAYAENPPEKGKEKKPMSLMDKLKALFTEEGIEVEGTPQSESKAGFSVDGVDYSAADVKRLKADADAYRAEATQEMKKAHVRCFGKEMEAPRVATFATQPLAEIRDLTKTWHETADAKFGTTASRGATRQTEAAKPGAAFGAGDEEARKSALDKAREDGRKAHENRTGKRIPATGAKE